MAKTATQHHVRYRAPSITPECEPVSLNDFDLDDIRAYLHHHGYVIASEKNIEDTASQYGLVISEDELDRIETLALCGQTMHARDEILDMVSKRIGRRL